MSRIRDGLNAGGGGTKTKEGKERKRGIRDTLFVFLFSGAIVSRISLSMRKGNHVAYVRIYPLTLSRLLFAARILAVFFSVRYLRFYPIFSYRLSRNRTKRYRILCAA